MKAPEMYKREVGTCLEILEADVARLKSRSAKRETDGPSRFDAYVAALDRKREELGEQLANLPDGGDEGKESIERGLKEAWDRLAIAKRAADARFH